ncbi:hypothetical protein DFH27DRAFT_574055 [Peziza echinospora]|nr:hypothetical protein DFH27DRAFT_574055 [Peziza echinospora]
MGIKTFLIKVHLSVLLPLAFLSTVYLYLYPVWHKCGFEAPGPKEITGSGTKEAPFRLLTLADPQIEGDSSLRKFARTRTEIKWKHFRRREDEEGDGEGDGDGMMSVVATIKAFTRAVLDRDHLRDVGNGYLEELKLSMKYLQKKVDLWGNDLYLAHVYRTMHWYTNPTHVVVLGDLVGSQWISDDEFLRRGRRFWDVIFRGGVKVTPEDVYNHEVSEGGKDGGGGGDWTHRIMNVVGNHDVGYAGDMTRERIDRFEDMFGQVNYMLTIHAPGPPEGYTPNATLTNKITTAQGGEEVIDPDELIPPVLRILLLNSLSLDTPIKDQSIATDSYDGINLVLKNRTMSPLQATILLTHLPFHKPEGICADGPFIDYFPAWDGGGIREQNHLSETTSQMLLGWLFALPTNSDDMHERKREKGIILTGHDHVGCDIWHFYRRFPDPEEENGDDEEEGEESTIIPTLPRPEPEWTAVNYINKDTMMNAMKSSGAFGKHFNASTDFVFEGLREVTVRSMMGEFGGNAGLVSAWFDWSQRTWRFKYTTCSLGIQHIWWAVHVVDLIAAITSLVLTLWHVLSLVFSTTKVVVGPGKKEQ